MIIFKTGKFTKKLESKITAIIEEISDTYSDFYITRDNLRLSIKENLHLFFESLIKGDSIVYSEEEGIAFLSGWSDKSNRKYIKILSKSIEDADKLLKVISWNCKSELFAKVKKNNPIRKTLEMNGFRFFGDRGNEILLSRGIRKFKEKTIDKQGEKE